MRKTHTIKNFAKLSNNEQINELTQRHNEIKAEFKKYFNYLQYKYFSGLSKEEQKNIRENEKYEKLWEIYNNFFNEMAELVEYMGQYENENE